MGGVEDRRVGQRPAGGGEHVVAEPEAVVKVDHVGGHRCEQGGPVLEVEALVPSAPHQRVKLLGLDVEEVVVRVRPGQPEARAGMSVLTGPWRSHATDEHRLQLTAVAHGSVQRVGVDLGASGDRRRMVVDNVENPEQLRPPD
jgi:hypothetical protein